MCIEFMERNDTKKEKIKLPITEATPYR